MSSTNVPCSLVTPLYGKLAWAPLLQIYDNFHKTYTFRRVVARVVVRVVVAENKENLNFIFLITTTRATTRARSVCFHTPWALMLAGPQAGRVIAAKMVFFTTQSPASEQKVL